jgi:hypothetical protein
LLSACSPSNQGNEWFPLREGDQHTLAVQFTGDEPRDPERWTLRVTAPTTFQDQAVAVRHHSAGVSYYLLSDDQGIRRIATRTDIDNEPTADAEQSGEEANDEAHEREQHEASCGHPEPPLRITAAGRPDTTGKDRGRRTFGAV